MTQSTSNPQPVSEPQSQPQSQPHAFAPAPSFSTLQQYIQAASVSTASSDRSSLYHLVVAIFTAARAAVRCLSEHYQARPHALTPDLRARLQYCATRLKAIFYTLCHAPNRFLTAGQFRALYRTQVILAHLWRQPVDLGPLVPWLTAPENCPPPPRSAACPPLALPEVSPRTPHAARRASSSPADPRLLLNPARALAAVFTQLAAIYGVASKPVAIPRPATTSQPNSSSNASLPPSPVESPASRQAGMSGTSSPRSTLCDPHFPHPPP